MNYRFYKFFVRNIKQFLLNDGGELVLENKFGILIKISVEQILIPKRDLGFVQVLFLKDKEIVDRFITTTNYRINAENKFKSFYKKRQFKTLAEYDKL